MGTFGFVLAGLVSPVVAERLERKLWIRPRRRGGTPRRRHRRAAHRPLHRGHRGLGSFVLIAGFLYAAALVAQLGISTRARRLEELAP
jgi:hypothetical protein